MKMQPRHTLPWRTSQDDNSTPSYNQSRTTYFYTPKWIHMIAVFIFTFQTFDHREVVASSSSSSSPHPLKTAPFEISKDDVNIASNEEEPFNPIDHKNNTSRPSALIISSSSSSSLNIISKCANKTKTSSLNPTLVPSYKSTNSNIIHDSDTIDTTEEPSFSSNNNNEHVETQIKSIDKKYSKPKKVKTTLTSNTTPPSRSRSNESLRRLKREWRDAVQLGVAYDWSKMRTVSLNRSKLNEGSGGSVGMTRRSTRRTIQKTVNGERTTATFTHITTTTTTTTTTTNNTPHNKHSYIRIGPISGNLLRWHFSYTGPPGPQSPYSTGIYHGCILLPKDYPLSPPRVQVLTPNGRFRPGADICLTASHFHPETWTPRWTVLALVNALRLHMLTTANEIGGVLESDSTRRELARRSRVWKWKGGKGKVNVDHEKMLELFFEGENRLEYTENERENGELRQIQDRKEEEIIAPRKDKENERTEEINQKLIVETSDTETSDTESDSIIDLDSDTEQDIDTYSPAPNKIKLTPKNSTTTSLSSSSTLSTSTKSKTSSSTNAGTQTSTSLSRIKEPTIRKIDLEKRSMLTAILRGLTEAAKSPLRMSILAFLTIFTILNKI